MNFCYVSVNSLSFIVFFIIIIIIIIMIIIFTLPSSSSSFLSVEVESFYFLFLCITDRLILILFSIFFLQLENLTVVSSDLQTRVASSRDKSETLLNETLDRDINLPGKHLTQMLASQLCTILLFI